MNFRHAATVLLPVLAALITACGKYNSDGLQGGIEGSGRTVTSAGAVTALGSIVVNGVEYDVAGAMVTVDGVLATESDLPVGSIVIVEGTLDPGGTTGKARRVTAGTAVAGPIDSVDIAHNRFTVLGQTIDVDLTTVVDGKGEGQPLGGLTIDSDVEVSGFADSSEVIHARRIAHRAEKPMLVTGRVADHDSANRRIAINGAIVDYSTAVLVGFGSRSLDDAVVRVTARGVDANGVVDASEVVYRDPGLPGAMGDAAALQGWVTRYASANDFDVDGRRVVVTADTTVLGSLALDSFVAVEGDLVAEGAVEISTVVAHGPFDVRVVDHPSGNPIEGAAVTVTVGGVEYRATSDADGLAAFADIPRGEVMLTAAADGYDTQTFPIFLGSSPLELGLKEKDWWTVGRPIVLGTHTVEVTSDGSAMTFSIDVAVIGPDSQALETLTSNDFSIGDVDCGWGGERDCASDAAGHATGIDGLFFWDGRVASFGLQPPMARRPYLVSVLAERSDRVADWEAKAPALKSFFSSVGGSDMVGLSSAQVENGVTTLTSLGPFTSDGSTYAAAIDELAQPAGDQPSLTAAIVESIRRVAAARDDMGSAADASVLVLGTPAVWDEAEMAAAVALARQVDVHIGGIESNTWSEYSYMAARTGGLVADTDDPRQLGIVFGAMDRLLAGSLPFYRMEFHLEGITPGTFVSGGNAKVRFVTHVPTSLKYGDLWTVVDVAIP